MTGVNAVQPNYATNSSGGSGDYTVRSGDTLSAIAQAHGVSTSALIAANPQISNPNLIRPGEQVHIPGGGGNSASYTVQAGDTLSGVAARYGVDWHDLARANGLSDPNLIRPGQELTIAGGRSSGSSGTGGVEAPGSAPGGGDSDVLKTAQQYLGRNASSLKTDRSDNLPMNAGVPSDVCCANFVSAVLTESGKLPANLHTDSVATLNSTLRHRGWTPVSASDAKPGDVVIIQGGGVSHTEIYAGNGKMIGSNNVNADGSQKISYNNVDWALDHGAVILRAPGGSEGHANGGSPSEAIQATGTGSHQDRIDQAMTYFEGKGWSHAQAAGIVANLDAESNMDAAVHQHGGGPGFGLGQWEGPRQAQFHQTMGRDIEGSSFSQQLDFVQWELTHTESGAGRALHGATSASDAGSIVTRLYERPADTAGEAARRADRAVEIAAR